ncbi:hypothetical protein FS837_003437 [Tulasnella sp. UAMH 9824]|nr:hypothetical protein FS837_003437 [Tulasnella sp. UAMH 9824]
MAMLERAIDASGCGATCEQISPPAECAYDDGACICENDEYIQSYAKCLQDSCTSEDVEKGAFVGKALCRAYVSALLLQSQTITPTQTRR